MTNFDLWPSLTLLFAGTNLAAWYFHGTPLFSWWWFLPIATLQVIISAAIMGIAKAITNKG
jgi:hypothetical protein